MKKSCKKSIPDPQDQSAARVIKSFQKPTDVEIVPDEPLSLALDILPLVHGGASSEFSRAADHNTLVNAWEKVADQYPEVGLQAYLYRRAARLGVCGFLLGHHEPLNFRFFRIDAKSSAKIELSDQLSLMIFKDLIKGIYDDFLSDQQWLLRRRLWDVQAQMQDRQTLVDEFDGLLADSNAIRRLRSLILESARECERIEALLAVYREVRGED